MKKSITTAICFLSALPCFASEVIMEVKPKSAFVRQSPDSSASVVGGLKEGDKVTVLQKPAGHWAKIRFSKNKEGYIWDKLLRPSESAVEKEVKEIPVKQVLPVSALVENEPQTERKPPVQADEERSLEDPGEKVLKSAGGPGVIDQPVPVTKIRTVGLAADDGISELKSINERLLKEMYALREEMRAATLCTVKEREDNEKRLNREIESRKKVEAEIAEIKSSLSFGGNTRLLALADQGEKVYLNGVGEVLLAFEGNRTVLRVSESKANKADRALLRADAEKFLRNGNAYYVVESKSLSF